MTQTVWKNSKVDTLYYDKEADTSEPCQVRLGDGQIEVSYEDENGDWVTYRGIEKGAGHFELEAPELNGRASLHMFPSGEFLEGYWVESGWRGMWRIRLS